ncbi:rod shape-determining protein MreD [Muribaculaceae bacterium Isolate-039 (Harlan)]|uniref:Rod shape-determining protein MreD n=1 Tax=Duncaniella muris TaxID=2094150 RepID=A0A2V1INB6_9BACT|nr:rod shape-determining protein MreD [Muribaculaceae bacterium S4]PWB04441.1 rod shape-determining protein MreD [Duncaniella muris]ROS91700.1 rod shape-determining protein MreD [Muribaculaceae bacterium Isolate-039 (Harlan)]
MGFILVLAQVIVFNHICLFNVAVPLVFIYLLVRLPITLSVNWMLTIGFFLGLIVDIFSDTYGMNTLACTIEAMMRKPILRLYVPREEDLTRPEPSMYSLGTATYLKYLLTLTLLYCSLIFLIEAFTFFNPVRLLLRIVFSTILSMALMIGIDSFMTPQSEKRL